MARELIQTELNVNELRAIVEESVKKALGNMVLSNADKAQIENLFSREQIAEELKISLPTLNSWTKKGLPVIKAPDSSRVYYDKNEVLSFLKSNQKSNKK